MRRLVTIASVFAFALLLAGCTPPTGAGELTEEQQRKGEEEMKKTEEEERGTPVKKRK